jgi:hypothetical protein
MMLFHRNCGRVRMVWCFLTGRTWWHDFRRGFAGIGRLQLKQQTADDVLFCSRTYICRSCRAVVHVDMDTPEGAVAEARATIQ